MIKKPFDNDLFEELCLEYGFEKKEIDDNIFTLDGVDYDLSKSDSLDKILEELSTEEFDNLRKFS